MSNSRDERYPVSSRYRRSPPTVHSPNGPFSSEVGGRTVLPPLSSGFQVADPYSENPLEPSRMSPSRNDLFSPSFPNDHWSNNNHMMAGHHAYSYPPYEVERGYPAPSPPPPISMRQSPPIHPDHGLMRRAPPPLSIPHVPQDPGHLYHSQNNFPLHSLAEPADMHSPTSMMNYGDYPYSSTYPPFHGSGYDVRHHLPHPSLHFPQEGHPPPHRTSHPVDWGAHPGRSDTHLVSPYARGPRDMFEPSPQEHSPIDFPLVKKKRKRADAAQLKVLNDVYNRTAFPTTEERMELAKKLDMSARSVQIWFQNKRQASRQNRSTANALPPIMHHPYTSSAAMPSSSHLPEAGRPVPTPHRRESSVSPMSHNGSYPSRSPGTSSSRGPREPSPRPPLPPPVVDAHYGRGRSPAYASNNMNRSMKHPGY